MPTLRQTRPMRRASRRRVSWSPSDRPQWSPSGRQSSSSVPARSSRKYSFASWVPRRPSCSQDSRGMGGCEPSRLPAPRAPSRHKKEAATCESSRDNALPAKAEAARYPSISLQYPPSQSRLPDGLQGLRPHGCERHLPSRYGPLESLRGRSTVLTQPPGIKTSTNPDG